MNPKGWDVVKIGDIATEVKYGTSLPAVEGGKYPYLRMNNMTNDGHLDLSNLKYIYVPDDEIEKCIVRKGDVLFNRTNSVELVGKTCVFDLDEEMIIAGYIIRVRIHETMLPIIFSNYMNTDVIKQYLRKIAKGAVNQANINAKELQAIQIYLPPLDLQNQFADFVAQVDKSKLVAQKSLKLLERIVNCKQEVLLTERRVRMNTGIKPQVLQEICELAVKYGVEQVILFGSRARGDHWAKSDIDLAIRGGDGVRFALDVEAHASTLLTFDIVDLNEAIAPELRDSIAREGVVLYEKV